MKSLQWQQKVGCLKNRAAKLFVCHHRHGSRSQKKTKNTKRKHESDSCYPNISSEKQANRDFRVEERIVRKAVCQTRTSADNVAYNVDRCAKKETALPMTTDNFFLLLLDSSSSICSKAESFQGIFRLILRWYCCCHGFGIKDNVCCFKTTVGVLVILLCKQNSSSHYDTQTETKWLMNRNWDLICSDFVSLFLRLLQYHFRTPSSFLLLDRGLEKWGNLEEESMMNTIIIIPSFIPRIKKRETECKEERGKNGKKKKTCIFVIQGLDTRTRHPFSYRSKMAFILNCIKLLQRILKREREQEQKDGYSR